MNECIPLPLAVLENQQYQVLSVAERLFLIDLYALFHDCERFTIDITRPQDYRQVAGANLARKISALLEAGLIRIDGSIKGKQDSYRRVFAFTHPTYQIELAA